MLLTYQKQTTVWGVIKIPWLPCSYENNSDLYGFPFRHDILFWRVSVAGLVTRIRTGQSGVLIPAVSDDFLFSRISRQALESTRPPIQWVPVFFPGDKAWPFTSVWRWASEWVELYLFFSSSLWCGLGHFTVTFTSLYRHNSTCGFGSKLIVVSVSNFHVDITLTTTMIEYLIFNCNWVDIRWQ
jgi:hypothetical protein